MAKFNRFNGNVLPFGSSSSVGERWTFGSGGSLVSNDIDDNLNTDYLAGWEAGLNAEGYPTSQDFNAHQYTNSLLVSYLFQTGIAEWNTSQEYYINSYCVGSDGKLYKAKTGTTSSPNQGNNPISDSTNWKKITVEDTDINMTGMVLTFPISSAPSGFLECDGSELSRTTYSDLFAVIGTTYGVGDGSTTFSIPDLRGEFIRGFDNGRGIDTGRTIGTSQADDNKSHSHSITDQTGVYDGGSSGVWGLLASSSTGNQNGPLAGKCVRSLEVVGSEARPRNIAMMYCIKY